MDLQMIIGKDYEMKGEKALSLELVEEAARDFNKEALKATERIETALPRMLFQEKHTSGHLWWKRSYYTYYKYSQGSMLAISIYPRGTIESVEKGK